MKTTINSIVSEINVPGANGRDLNVNEINQNNGSIIKTRPHIVAARAARQARRASRYGA